MTIESISERRRKIRSLGTGMYGEVWLELDVALNVERAVKYVDASVFDDENQTFAEPRTLQELRSDYTVEVFEAGIEEGQAYTVMQYMPQGSLGDLLTDGPIRLTQAKKWMIDICRAVEFVHRKGWIHRDIKPSNVLLAESGTAKLSDFGHAARMDAHGSASPAGYGPHLAPELFTTKQTSRLTDIYSLGMTMYRLVNGDEILPDYTSFPELRSLILEKRYPDRSNHRPYVPAPLRKIISKALHIDPAQRYQSAHDLRLALESVAIHCDWVDEASHDGTTVWRTAIGNMKYEVIHATGRTSELTVLKGTNKLRRVGSDSAASIRAQDASKKCAAILQRITTQGR